MKQFSAWVILIILAFIAQSWILSQHILLGLLLFELSGLGLFVLFYAHLKPEKESSSSPLIQLDLLWIPFCLGLICAGLAAWWMWDAVNQPVNASRFDKVAYACIAFLGLIIISSCKPIYQSVKQTVWSDYLPLLILIGITLCIGLYKLTEVPYTVHGDEGMVGLFARRIYEGNIPTFFSTAWYSLPQFFFWVPSVGLHIFGDSLFGLRFSSVLVGVLSVVSFYVVCRSMWGTAAAVFSGMLLIVNHWFIHLNHSGVSYIQALWFAITAFCLLHFMNRKRSVAIAALGGIVLGLGLMSYQANHLLPILWVVSQVWLFITRQIDWKWLIISILVPLIISILVIAPLLIYLNSGYAEHEMFTQRAEGVGIWTDTNWRHLDGVYRANGNTGLVIREQVKRALFAPMLYADMSIQYNGQSPMLGSVSAALWGGSVALALFMMWKGSWSLPLIWTFAILLAGGALTVDSPFFPRLSGTTGMYFLLIAGMFGTVYKALDEKPYWQYAAYGITILIVAMSAWVNVNHYFNHFANEISPKNIHAKQTRLGYFMLENCDEKKLLFVSGSHTSTNSGTCRFLAKNCKAQDIQALPQNLNMQDTIVVIDASRMAERSQLKEEIPSVVERAHYLPGGQVAFYSYSMSGD